MIHLGQRVKTKPCRSCGMSKLVVYALGGNALQAPGRDSDTSADVLAKVMSDVVDLLEMDWRVVMTHGNGPQVGHLLALDREHSHGLDAWVAATQGTIGHQLSQHLQSILDRRRRPERTVVVLTHAEVDPNDDGFSWPTKPVGPVLDSTTVMTADWDIAHTIHGPRRVVASPVPLRVVELETIRHLVSLQAVVICGGGGGIPVVRQDGLMHGVPAVVDKDLLSSCLASDLNADALIISTEANAIYSSFGTEHAVEHRTLSPEGLRHLESEGEFPPGSMGPKARALREYVERSGGTAVLCSPGNVLKALRGECGTTVTPSSSVN